MEYISRQALNLHKHFPCSSDKRHHFSVLYRQPFPPVLEILCRQLKKNLKTLFTSNLKIWTQLSDFFFLLYSEFMNWWDNDSTKSFPDYIVSLEKTRGFKTTLVSEI